MTQAKNELDVFQSLWAMELRRPDAFEWSPEEQLEKIAVNRHAQVLTDPRHAAARDGLASLFSYAASDLPVEGPF